VLGHLLGQLAVHFGQSACDELFHKVMQSLPMVSMPFVKLTLSSGVGVEGCRLLG